MNDREMTEPTPTKKLELKKESLMEMTGWDIRDLSGGCTTVTTTCGDHTCGHTTSNSACCPPYK